MMIKELDQTKLKEGLQVLHMGYEPIAVQFGLTNDNCPYRGRADLPLEVLAEEYSFGTKMYGYYKEDYMTAFLSLNISQDVIKINDIVVLPKFWHNGIGTALLKFAKDMATEQNISNITLGMIDENKVLRKWYEKNGFVNVGYKKYPKAPFIVGYMEWTAG